MLLFHSVAVGSLPKRKPTDIFTFHYIVSVPVLQSILSFLQIQQFFAWNFGSLPKAFCPQGVPFSVEIW
jgi:hypothetical protein